MMREWAQVVHREFISRGKTLAVVESCTGGALAAQLTALAGASSFFLGAIVAYSNGWKEKFLGVRHEALLQFGAVSVEVVEEMVEGLFVATEADFAVATSGIAGPSGGTDEKPVGTIYIGIGKRGEKSDVGLVKAPSQDRASAIDFAVQTALKALYNRLVHNIRAFS